MKRWSDGAVEEGKRAISSSNAPPLHCSIPSHGRLHDPISERCPHHPRSAAAPDTTSISSLVMAAWRPRL